MLHVCCVNHGNYQGRGADYVNRLYTSVARNLFPAVEGRFVCFTDDDTGLAAGIHAEPLPKGVEGWWNKLWLFAPGLFPRGDRVLYFDLDTVIIGPIEKLAAYDGEFAILRDFYRPDGLQSSVMAWPAGFGAEIWHSWVQAGKPGIEGGDQAWIERCVEHPVVLQNAFPDIFCSYKRDCNPFPPENASVVVFHGDPKPHDCGRAWVAAMWSERDNSHFQLGMVPNVPIDQIRKQIKHSATLDLPRLKSQPPREGKVAVVGGGPSLNDPITLIELNRFRATDGHIWALNGSYDWLLAQGIVADAHVIIDARPDNCQFLKQSRPETTYYIASQCNWVVYDYLMRRKRKIVRLDLDVMGDCGTTVGTHAILTAFVEGFRDIHLFGYDSSYREDDGHAYPQAVNAGESVVDAHIGDRVFKAAPWMVRQAQDFDGIARDVVAAGGMVTVHGDGLLPCMANLLVNPPPSAAQIRAQEVLKRLPEGPVKGVEIGVFVGEMSAALLQRKDLELVMVDAWEGEGASYAAESGDWHAKLSQDEQDEFRKRAMRAVEFAGDRAQIIPERSVNASREIADRSLDFVFIDADHSYDGCAEDLLAWAHKIKHGGLLCGHDYDNPDFPDFGVSRAVDEFAAACGRNVELGENLTWFIRL